jgi:hypothetical protein
VALHEAEGLLFISLAETDVPAPPRIPLAGRRFAEAVTTEVAANWKAAVEAVLDEDRWRLEWPLGLVRDDGPARIVRHVVPRSFSRTRFVDLVFTDGAPASMETLRDGAQVDKGAAEIRQAKLAEGAASPPSAGSAVFRERIAAAAPPG